MTVLVHMRYLADAALPTAASARPRSDAFWKTMRARRRVAAEPITQVEPHTTAPAPLWLGGWRPGALSSKPPTPVPPT
jgi:hypothetical protein